MFRPTAPQHFPKHPPAPQTPHLPRMGESIETGSKSVVARGPWGREEQALDAHGSRVSFGGDEQLVGWSHNSLNVLKITL